MTERPAHHAQGAGRATLFVGARQVVTCAGPGRARRGAEMADAGVREGVAVAVVDGRIARVGPADVVAREYPGAAHVACGGRVLTPGLIDSHTHLVFGRPRADEQELRAAGAGYMEIAGRGGGIHASVRDFRARGEDEILALARDRLARVARYGVTTVEIKSGYGLSLDDERKALRVIARLAAESALRIVPTWLGAHEIPQEWRTRPEGRRSYVRLLADEVLPVVARERLARFADVFCEPGVFSVAEAREILDAARAAGLGVKLHADELEPSGGAELGVALGAVSVDHLAAISEAGITALAASATVATLLPGTMLFLGRAQQAPARRLIEAGAAVALATDFNPGTSPTPNLPLVLTLGVSQLHLSAAESIVAATVNGAAALGLAGETGQIAPGYAADVALWECEDYREIPYWYGDARCAASWVSGREAYRGT